MLYRPGNLSCINPCLHNITVEAFRLRSISGTVSRVCTTCNTPCTVGYGVVFVRGKRGPVLLAAVGKRGVQFLRLMLREDGYNVD